SPGLQLLQRIRDEAHRFAVGFHRQRRDTRSFASIFDELEGVGPARRRALLQYFGSAERFLAATQEELEGVPGVPPKPARAIYAQLHKAGRPWCPFQQYETVVPAKPAQPPTVGVASDAWCRLLARDHAA